MDSNTDDEITDMEYMLKKSVASKNKMAIIVKVPSGKTKFCCVKCPERYDSKERLEKHLVVHNRVYKFLCGICGTGLKRREHLDRHTLEHQELRPHVCEDCGKGFKRKEHLNIHRTIHTGDKSQACELCGKAFYRKDHLQKHMHTHNKMFIEQNIFPLNDEELMNIKQEYDEDAVLDPLDDRIQMVDEGVQKNISFNHPKPRIRNSGGPRPFACHLCPKDYKRKDHLKLHLESHSKKNKVCSQCGMAFYKETHLTYHMRLHDNDEEEQVNNDEEEQVNNDEEEQITGEELPLESMLEQNSVNGEYFASDNSLLIPRDLNGESCPHICPVCPRKYKTKYQLIIHAGTHLQQHSGTILCSVCNTAFESDEEFENHPCMTCEVNGDEEMIIEEMHPAPSKTKKENKFPIDLVKVEMGHSDEVQFAFYRDEDDVPVPQRVYVCKYCAKPFKRKDHYRIHQHIHTGVKSFFCPHCEKGFYRKDHLQKHIQVHSKLNYKPKKTIPALYPINPIPKRKEVKPEITITAPSSTKLRVPLQIKVPYQMVMSMDNGEQHAVTIDPTHDDVTEILP